MYRLDHQGLKVEVAKESGGVVGVAAAARRHRRADLVACMRKIVFSREKRDTTRLALLRRLHIADEVRERRVKIKEKKEN